MKRLELVYGPLLSSNISTGYTIMSGFAPDLDDFTQSRVTCQHRFILRQSELNLIIFHHILFDIYFVYTWTDWTEGSQFGPDVMDRTQNLVLLR